MKLQGKLSDVSIDYKTNKKKLTFLINNNITSLEEIENVELLDIEAKKHRKKRSLDANAYCWKIITEIADILRKSKDEVYEDKLFEYGQVIIVPTEKGKMLDGYFKYYRYFQDGVLNGKECDWYKVAKGSSEFDTREMSVFIDGVVQDAQELGIVTDTPEQIAKYKEMWK